MASVAQVGVGVRARAPLTLRGDRGQLSSTCRRGAPLAGHPAPLHLPPSREPSGAGERGLRGPAGAGHERGGGAASRAHVLLRGVCALPPGPAQPPPRPAPRLPARPTGFARARVRSRGAVFVWVTHVGPRRAYPRARAAACQSQPRTQPRISMHATPRSLRSGVWAWRLLPVVTRTWSGKTCPGVARLDSEHGPTLRQGRGTCTERASEQLSSPTQYLAGNGSTHL